MTTNQGIIGIVHEIDGILHASTTDYVGIAHWIWGWDRMITNSILALSENGVRSMIFRHRGHQTMKVMMINWIKVRGTLCSDKPKSTKTMSL